MTVHGGDSWDIRGLGAVPLAEDDPREIGPFTLLGRLGSGGMGRVYLGLAEGRFAAVKQVHPHLAEDRGFLRRFGHELDNLARLPAGVSAELLDSDRRARPPWLATSYVPGITLDEALEANAGPLPLSDLWPLLREAAAELAAVHEIGIVHRDLKPSNVMLRPDGVTLIDFGVAQALEQSRLTQTGMAIGTPAYMSPEQAAGQKELTAATDVFALGCLLGHAATGCPPYGDGGGVQMLYRIIHQDPDLAPLRAVDEELATLVARCLVREPRARPTAADLCLTAAQHVPGDAVLWPAPVRQLVSRHVESAKHVPERAARPGPEPGSEATLGLGSEPDPEPDPEPESDPVPGPGIGPEKGPGKGPGKEQGPAGTADAGATTGPPASATPERRRWRGPRVLVIPLILAATGGAVALAPYVISPGAHTPPAAVGSSAAGASAVGGSSSAVTPSTAASSAKPRSSPTHHAGAALDGRNTSGTVGSSSKAGGAANAPGGSAKTGGSGGSGASGATGGSGGGSSSGSSGGSGTTATGTHRLRSAMDGHCLVHNLNHSTSAYVAACTSAADFRWTYAALSGGTFELRNTDSGNCLAGSGNNFTYMVTCNTTDADVWRFGSTAPGGTTVVNVSAGQCLQNGLQGFAVTSGCTKAADMSWAND